MVEREVRDAAVFVDRERADVVARVGLDALARRGRGEGPRVAALDAVLAVVEGTAGQRAGEVREDRPPLAGAGRQLVGHLLERGHGRIP